MAKNIIISESHVLRRVLGGAFIFLAVIVLFFAVLAVKADAYILAVLAFSGGLFFARLGYFAFPINGSNRVRLQLTDQGLWLLPDNNEWFLLKKSAENPLVVPWDEIVGIDDGGVLYGYRKLRFFTEETSYHINTTFLDCQPRSIISEIDRRLRQNCRRLVEQGLGMAARSGKWRVEEDNVPH